jgi:hypothetical protein
VRHEVGARGHVLKDRAIFGENAAIVGVQDRHHAERMNLAAVGRAARRVVDGDVLGGAAELLEGDARCHRAGEGRIEEFHAFTDSRGDECEPTLLLYNGYARNA